MNTVRTSCGNPPHFALIGFRRLIAIGLLSLALVACGGDGAMTPDPGPGAPPPGSPGGSTPDPGDEPPGDPPGDMPMLDCIQEDYPCSFDEVSLQVIEHSLALSDEVARQLEDGVDIEDVAAFLAAQSEVADVTVDGPVLGFRLAGGRPMIVDVTGDQEFLPSESAASASGTQDLAAHVMAQAVSPKAFRAVRTATTQAIVGGDKSQRHALVLSPFRYEENFGNSGALVAEALNGIRGYAGNVTYLATTNEFEPQVTVDVLTQLEQYDVIQIDTHGGTICKDKAVPAPVGLIQDKDKDKDKDKKTCENGITDFLVQRFHGTAQDLQSVAHPGVIHYRGRLNQSIAVTADFFRHYYPDGLSDTLFVLGSCNTFRTDMAEAIAGSRGVFMSWDGSTEESLVRGTSLAMLDYLGAGLTVGEAHVRLPDFSPTNPGAEGSVLRRSWRKVGGDLRIRDLLTVRDNLTGRLVSDTSGIEVMEYPGDGQNDHLDLEFTVDGISPAQLANFFVNLVIDNHVIGHLNMQMSGVQIDEFSYRVSTPVPLPFDVHQGQALNMDFWIPLPDLGENHFIAAPRVNERDEPEVGLEWVLTSRAVTQRTDDLTTLSASVVFEIEPDSDPDARYQFFRVRNGSVNVQRDYEDARGCHFNINHTIDIPAAALNHYLRFDTGNQNLLLSGFGNVASETVPATSSCGDSVDVKVGGVYFVAEDSPVLGESAHGGYHSGGTFPTLIEWNLSRSR